MKILLMLHKMSSRYKLHQMLFMLFMLFHEVNVTTFKQLFFIGLM